MPHMHVAIIKHACVGNIDNIDNYDPSDFDLLVLHRHDGVQLPQVRPIDGVEKKASALKIANILIGDRDLIIRRCFHVPRSALYVVVLRAPKSTHASIEQPHANGSLFFNMAKLADIQEVYGSFHPQTIYHLDQLDSWLRNMFARHRRQFIVNLFKKRSVLERLSECVHNPGDLHEIKSCQSHINFVASQCSTSSDSVVYLTKKHSTTLDGTQLDEMVEHANVARTSLISLDKCHKLVRNPIFKCAFDYTHAIKFYCRDLLQHDESISKSMRSSMAHSSTSTSSGSVADGGVEAFQSAYPLHNAAYTGDVEKIQTLIKHGFSANENDPYSWTPLHYAVWYNHLDCIAELISYGKDCDVNAKSKNGSTPLHFAVKVGAVNVVQLLTSHASIDLDAKDNESRSALDIAQMDMRQESKQCADILRAAFSRKQWRKIEIELINGDKLMIPMVADEHTTAQQLHKLVCDELDIVDDERHFFKLWLCSPSLELQLKNEHRPEAQQARWSVYTRKYGGAESEIASLVFRRDTRLAADEEMKGNISNKTLDLLYWEAKHNFLKGLYPCPERDMLTLSAIILQTLVGDYINDSNDKRVLNFESSRRMIMPRNCEVIYSGKSYDKLISKLVTMHKNLSSKAPRSMVGLEVNFLSICRSFLVYGATFFEAEMFVTVPKTAMCNVLAGVNDYGLHLLNASSCQLMKSHQVEKLTFKHEADKPFIEFSTKERAFTLRTPKAQHIVMLLKQAQIKRQ